MKKTDPYRRRLIVLLSFLAAVLVFFGMVMFHYQIVNGDSYRAKSVAGTAKREIVETSRGIITDRNGKVLVSNRLAYTLTFSKKAFQTDAELNDAIWKLIGLCRETDTVWVDTLPISQSAPYLYLASRNEEAFTKFLDSSKLELQRIVRQGLDILRKENA